MPRIHFPFEGRSVKPVSYTHLAMKVSSSGSEEVAFVSDVSCEQAFVEQLAALCTQLQLYPCHLYDVVLDAIS